MSRWMICLVALAAQISPLSAQQAQVKVPVVAMEDQFETAHDVKQHRGDVVVLIYGDRASAKANQTLGERIHVHFHPTAKGLPPEQASKAPVKPVEGSAEGARSPDVKAVPVACVGKVPTLVQRIIRAQIKQGAPHVPVWLDFHDVMKAQFPFKASVPNVVVLDAQGRYRYAAAGQPTEAGVKRLLDVIEALRGEALK